MKLTREADLAGELGLTHRQFRLLRRRHRWAYVEFSRQDIRYTDAQIEQLVNEITKREPRAKPKAQLEGQTSRSRGKSRVT